jgi:hypothetical protein
MLMKHYCRYFRITGVFVFRGEVECLAISALTCTHCLTELNVAGSPTDTHGGGVGGFAASKCRHLTFCRQPPPHRQ